MSKMSNVKNPKSQNPKSKIPNNKCLRNLKVITNWGRAGFIPQLGLPKGVLTGYQSNRSAEAACPRPGFPGEPAPPRVPRASGAWFPAPK